MEFNKYFDHTFLKAFATEKDIDTLCQQARELNTASVCVNEEWVAYCKELLKDTNVMVCSVVGFPLGQCGLNTKAYETKEALKDGADEIDYVLNVGDVKMGKFDKVKEEMETLTNICHEQNKGIKVILNIPWWRSHSIHENRATESICTEPCNPLLRATKSMKRATSTY